VYRDDLLIVKRAGFVFGKLSFSFEDLLDEEGQGGAFLGELG
jgi:hypothetical protein